MSFCCTTKASRFRARCLSGPCWWPGCSTAPTSWWTTPTENRRDARIRRRCSECCSTTAATATLRSSSRSTSARSCRSATTRSRCSWRRWYRARSTSRLSSRTTSAACSCSNSTLSQTAQSFTLPPACSQLRSDQSGWPFRSRSVCGRAIDARCCAAPLRLCFDRWTCARYFTGKTESENIASAMYFLQFCILL